MRFHILPLVLACGCATDVASKGDVRALKEQVESLQKENAQLQGRVDALEHERLVVAPTAAAAPTPAAASASPAAPVAAAPPVLTVVKLKPKASPPPLDVETPVQEPDLAVLDVLAARPEPALSTPLASADQEYQAALEALRTGNVGGAIDRLKHFASTYPKHPKADDALYYAALGEIGRGELAAAAALLEAVVQRYPAGDVVQDALLKLGEVRVRLRQPAEARATYAQLVQTFPGTPAAVQAQARLSMLSRDP